MITIIAAAGQHNELGKDNDLIWHLPDDFKRFKTLTTGHYIIMGRKTFESFPKPLPNRTHLVITRDKAYTPKVPEGKEKNVIMVYSIDQALLKSSADETVYVIGGGEIYSQAMQIADRIELTRVHGTFEADTFFPEIDTTRWEKTSEIHHTIDEKHLHAFTYETWDRI
jgi:dihydrofolate reductase